MMQQRFNQDISEWDVSSVSDMTSMFNGAASFNKNINNWYVLLIDIEPINFSLNSILEFDNEPNWGLKLEPFTNDTLKIAIKETKNGRYKGVRPNDWDVSKVTDMSYLFKNNKTFNDEISKWDVSSVTDMKYMFNNAKDFDQYIGDWDVSNVICNMQKILYVLCNIV